MTKDTLYIGLDTDKKWIDISIAEPLPGGEVRYFGKIANQAASLDRVLKRLGKEARALIVCYEAGPCGYGIYRRLDGRPGVSCQVIAPSLTPRRAGDRVKTNRRDSLSLAKLLRAEELTAVWVPDAAHEAMRDLIRARGAAVSDLTRCRQRIGGFLLRQEIGYVGKPWSKKHRVWLGRLAFGAAAHRLMFTELLDALDQTQARLDRLVEHIAELWPGWSLAWLVEALQTLRGYALINAATVVAEIGDPRRFDSPRQLMSFVGLVPSERSSGESVRRGALTKTGNGRARKALIEAAWTYTRPAKALKAAAAHQPAEIRAIADKARHRLSGRYRRLVQRGKRPQVAIAAVARESLGFIWAIAQAAGPRQG
jgi:transposase